MKLLCWNTNESVWNHWTTILDSSVEQIRAIDFEQTVNQLSKGNFDYCFVYLGDEDFSEKVEDVVALREKFTNLKLVAFPNRRSQAAALRMLSMGVNGQCSPFIGKEQLKLVLSVIESGEIWGGKDFIQQLIQQTATVSNATINTSSGFEELSEREKTVAEYIGQGFSNKRIAAEMEITERTVKAHLTAIYQKLNVKDRLSLALLIQRGAVTH